MTGGRSSLYIIFLVIGFIFGCCLLVCGAFGIVIFFKCRKISKIDDKSKKFIFLFLENKKINEWERANTQETVPDTQGDDFYPDISP